MQDQVRVSVLLANHSVFCSSLVSDHLKILREMFLKRPFNQMIKNNENNKTSNVSIQH